MVLRVSQSQNKGRVLKFNWNHIKYEDKFRPWEFTDSLREDINRKTSTEPSTDDDNDGKNENYNGDSGNFDDNDEENDQKTYKYYDFLITNPNI